MRTYKITYKINVNNCAFVFEDNFTASSVNLHSKNSASRPAVFSYDCPISRRSYTQKVLCSDGLLFRRCYVWKVLCSEGPVFRRYLFKRCYVGTHFHLSVSGMKHFFYLSLFHVFLISFIILLFTSSWDTRE